MSAAMEEIKTNGFFSFDYFFRRLSGNLTKHSLKVLSGTVISAFFGFVASIYLAKVLGPSKFGIFSSCLVVMNFMIQLSSLGTGRGMIRVSAGGRDFGVSASEIFSVSATFQVLISFILGGCLLLNDENVGRYLLQKPELIPYIKVVCAGVIIGAAGQGLLFVFQACEMFGLYSLNKISMALLKVILFILVGTVFTLSAGNSLSIVIITLLFGFIFGIIMLPEKTFAFRSMRLLTFKKLFQYTRWSTIVQICGFATKNLPILLLTRFASTTEVGLYAVASAVAFMVALLSEALLTVLLPKYAKMSDPQELRRLNSSITRVLCLFCAPCLATLLFSRQGLVFVFGNEYTEATSILVVLVIARLIGMVTISYSTMLYRIKKSYLMSLNAMIKLFVLIVLSIMFVPKLGGIGMAYCALIVTIVGASIEFLIVNASFKVWINEKQTY
jgi:O-antigen/teichoic acid export membrane protein